MFDDFVSDGIIVLHPNTPERLTLRDNFQLHLQLQHAAQDVAFVLFQAHSYFHNVTISLNGIHTPGTYTNGTDVGVLASPTADNDNSASCFAQCASCQGDNVTLIVMATLIMLDGERFTRHSILI